MPRRRTLKIAAAVVLSFAGLAGTIIVLLAMEIISLTMAKLMLATLLGMYVGFGALIAAYVLINKLE
jgi:hypothetical protein